MRAYVHVCNNYALVESRWLNHAPKDDELKRMPLNLMAFARFANTYVTGRTIETLAALSTCTLCINDVA